MGEVWRGVAFPVLPLRQGFAWQRSALQFGEVWRGRRPLQASRRVGVWGGGRRPPTPPPPCKIRKEPCLMLQLFHGIVNTADRRSGTRAMDVHRSSCSSSTLSSQGE